MPSGTPLMVEDRALRYRSSADRHAGRTIFCVAVDGQYAATLAIADPDQGNDPGALVS